MDNQEMTPGQKRVRCNFNPNALPIVECIKAQTSALLDTLDEYGRQVIANTANIDSNKGLTGDFMREIATAKTEIQGASMWAVGAVTHPTAMDAMKGQLTETITPDRWVSFKEWEAYQQWKADMLTPKTSPEIEETEKEK